MYNSIFRLFAVFLALVPTLLFSQSGTIKGTVLEDESGETLIGVTVMLDGTDKGTSTDFDGAFEITADPGVYDVVISYISYESITIPGVEVVADQVNQLDVIKMLSESEMIEEIVITAAVVRSSEAALMTIKKKSSSLVDGISASKFKKIGDSNAASAVKRVTGVSVEGGKYVYVRGLGDRYTKTMLNSIDIPGLDPDRNSLQIDIFPTNLISNMMVHKTAVAELPADFTGGVVNIETKEFPEEEMFDVSFSLGFNPSMHLNSDFLTQEGSSTDWLGFDDGTRALPKYAQLDVIPSPVSGYSDGVVGDFVSSFNPNLATTTKTSLPDFSFGASYGNQKTFDNDNKLGYIFSGTYKKSNTFYDSVNLGEYQRPIESDAFELVSATTQQGQVSEENVLLGGMAGLAFKTKNSKHKLAVIHLQNGESKTAMFDIDNNSDAVGQSGFIAHSNNLEYSQRRVTNVLLNGQYFNADGTWDAEWSLSPTLSSMTDPDVRKTAFSEIGGGDLFFSAGAGGNPSRIWRFLDEVSLVGKADITRSYQLFDREAKLKFGAGQVVKERDYNILTYNLQFFGGQPDYNGDVNNVLSEEFLFPQGNVYYASGNNNPNPNAYNSTSSNTSAYVSNEFYPYASLKAIVGLRMENYVQRHTGRDVQFASQGVGNNLEDEVVLNSLDLFPSINLSQTLSENQNLRFSYSKTIARPSFKELSYAQIIDPLSNRIFNGGLFTYNDWDGQLTETRINNLDLRWEAFKAGGQLISVSAFYKHFDKPIELVRIPEAQTSNEFQPRNVGDGQVFGLELELRRKLGFISPMMENFSFNTNITLAKSQIEMTQLESDARLAYAKIGEEVTKTRAMAGQAPYIINTGLVYNAIDKALDMGLYYNVKGETLVVVGGGLFPDVYSQPFHSLKFSVNKSLGKEDRMSVSFDVDNLLNNVRVDNYQGFNATNQIYSSYNPGITFGLGLKYSII